MATLKTCATHSGAAAFWVCEKCDALRCPECVFADRAAHVELIGCCRCSAPVKPLKAHRSELSPFSARVKRAFGYPLGKDGLIAVVVVAAVTGVLELLFDWAPIFIKPFAFALWMGTFFGYVFHLIRMVSQGRDEFSPPDFTDFFSDLVTPAIRGVTATAILWAPSLAYVFLIRDGMAGLWRDPLLWIIGLASVAYVPMALMMVAAGGGVFQILNPLFVFANAVRLGRDYAIAAAYLGVLSVVHLAMHGLGLVVVKQIRVAFFAPWIAEALTLYAPFAGAYVMGTLLFTRGDAVDYGVSSEYFEPVNLAAQPSGTKPSANLAGGAFVRPAAISVEELEQVAPPPPSPSAPGPSALETLTSAVAAGQLDEAVDAYRRLSRVELLGTSGELHVTVAQKAVSGGDLSLAVDALKAAAQNLEDPAAPKACVILARVYAEKLGDAPSARKLYQHVVSRYPETGAADFARRQLAAG